MPSRTPHDPLSNLAARIEAGNRTADAISHAAVTGPVASRHVLLALASRIRLCNDPANSWYIPAATKKPIRLSNDAIVPHPDKPFDAIGRFWRCGSKLCPDCLARQARHNRKRLRAALIAQKRHPGERFSFATFTVPNIGLSLTQARGIVDRAWTLFRKRSLCASLIRGWSKSEEFTVTANGFHYHLHCILLHKWFLYNEVRRVWTDCVQTAFTEANLVFQCDNSDGLLRVVIDEIGKPVRRLGGRVFTLEQTIQEGCKYLTKSDSWTKVPPSDLIEVAMIRKWTRMFELGGSFRTLATEDARAAEPIVHTRLLSDGGPATSLSYWRDRVTTLDLDDYADELLDEWHRCVKSRTAALEARYERPQLQTYAEILTARAGP